MTCLRSLRLCRLQPPCITSRCARFADQEECWQIWTVLCLVLVVPSCTFHCDARLHGRNHLVREAVLRIVTETSSWLVSSSVALLSSSPSPCRWSVQSWMEYADINVWARQIWTLRSHINESPWAAAQEWTQCLEEQEVAQPQHLGSGVQGGLKVPRAQQLTQGATERRVDSASHRTWLFSRNDQKRGRDLSSQFLSAGKKKSVAGGSLRTISFAPTLCFSPAVRKGRSDNARFHLVVWIRCFAHKLVIALRDLSTAIVDVESVEKASPRKIINKTDWLKLRYEK